MRYRVRCRNRWAAETAAGLWASAMAGRHEAVEAVSSWLLRNLATEPHDGKGSLSESA
jgi:hypothetical protein